MAIITINVIAADDIVNAVEAGLALPISGTTTGVEDGRTVTVGLNGQTYTTTVLTNAWTLTVPLADVALLADGTSPVTANVSDLAGNAAPQATRSLTVDETVAAPVITSIGGNNVVSGQPGDAVVTGTTEVGSTVYLATNNGSNPLTGPVTVAGSGWTYTLTPTDLIAIGQGSGKLLTAQARDAAGNFSLVATSAPFAIDTVAPAAPLFVTIGGGDSVVSGQPGDAVVTGTTAVGSTVALAFGATPLGSATVDGSGGWTYTLTGTNIAAIGQGAGKTLTAIATDAAGNPSGATTSASFAVDTVALAPTLLTLAPISDSGTPGDNITNVALPTITGSGADGATVTLLDGGTAIGTGTVAGGVWSIAATAPLNAGANAITATQTDVAGNTSSPSDVLNITLDTTSPVVTALTASPADAVLGAGALVTLTLGFSEVVTVDTTGGIPTLALNNGATATYASGSGTAALMFNYTVGSGQDVPDLAVTGGNLNGAIITDGAGNFADPTGAAGNPAGTLDIQSASIAAFNTSTGQSVGVVAQAYAGPVADLQNEYINLTSDNLNVSVATPNWFIHSGSGEDAIGVSSGTNVLDGGTGSNFLVGGSGTDTFFVDARGSTADIWSTVVNFHAGDAVTIWGVTPNDFNFTFEDNQGAAGFTGLTLHATAPGRPIASVTFAGFTTADLSNGRIAESSGIEPVSGSSYTYFHAIS